jgi:CTP synthase
MQCATIEFARNVAGMVGANSTEFDDEAPYKVIYKLRDLIGVDALGGTMRLGKYPCQLRPGSIAAEAYGVDMVEERHRHRYEANPEYIPALESKGFRVTGLSPDGKFVEIVELEGHPWFVGCQFHPEYRSRPMTPHPLFRSFIAASLQYKKADRQAPVLTASKPAEVV